jgi:hypothetical protein
MMTSLLYVRHLSSQNDGDIFSANDRYVNNYEANTNLSKRILLKITIGLRIFEKISGH